MKKAFILLMLFLLAKVSFAQNQHIYCLRVNVDGSTTITFAPYEATDFVSYIVSSYDESIGSFQQIAQLNDATQTQYNEVIKNANVKSLKYRINVNTLSQDTLSYYASTMYLTAEELAPSVIRLVWNDARTGYFGSEPEQYHVFRRFALSDTTWKERGTVSINGFIDSLPQLCSDTAFYRIEIANNNGCTSWSNERKVYVSDQQIPLEPHPLSISVDKETQKMHLSWICSTSSDTWGYVVCSGEPCLTIDTIWGKESNDYLCQSCNITSVNSLAVMAFDSCFNTSLRSESHKNIVLSTLWKACNEDINLSWTQYEGRSVDSYAVYVSKNSSAFELIATYSPAVLSCTYSVSSPIMDNDSYVFYVQALLQDGVVSYSNKKTCDFSAPPKVKYAYIRSAEVGANNKSVLLSFFVDTSIVVSHYDLWRAKSGEPLQKIARLPYSVSPSFSYTDALPQGADKSSFTYQLQVPDECDLYYSASNTLSTICLLLNSENNISFLTWNAPEGWEGINFYSVYRKIGSTDILLDNIYTNELSYSDDLTNTDHSTDHVSYYVVAKEQNPYPDSIQGHNSSSFATIKSPTIFWIANAFTPLESTNNIFKPSLLYIKENSYLFRIFNRWGKCIFSTNNISQGWNGYFDGKILPASSYIYVVEYIDSQGEKQKQSGTVNLVY